MGQVERAYEAAEKGYDAFIIGCGWDPALKECRSVVDIPVVAMLESAALLACTLGNKFSVIAFEANWVPLLQNIIRSYGLQDRLASVRCPSGIKFTDAFEMLLGGKMERQN